MKLIPRELDKLLLSQGKSIKQFSEQNIQPNIKNKNKIDTQFCSSVFNSKIGLVQLKYLFIILGKL